MNGKAPRNINNPFALTLSDSLYIVEMPASADDLEGRLTAEIAKAVQSALGSLVSAPVQRR